MTEIIDTMPNLNAMDQQQFTQALFAQARSEGVELMLCALAAKIWVLVALRLVQGIGGAFALVIANAVVRDRTSGAAAARFLHC